MGEIKQDLQKPCFFISNVNQTLRAFPGKRYKGNIQCVIQYLPESKENFMTECYSVAERMNWCLEEINVMDTAIRGLNMNYKIVEGILNYYVDYSFFTHKNQPQVNMEIMHSDTEAKG